MLDETDVWALLVIAGALIVITLVVCMNYTNWIALQQGYCQQQRVGSQSVLWTKCVP